MPCLDLNESDASMRQRLVNSLSQSFPGSVLTKALKCIKDEDADINDPFSSSCFAELCLDREIPDEDEELTSLTWLQDSNLLKDIRASEDEAGINENADVKLEPEHAHVQPIHGPYNPDKHVNSKPPYSFSCLIFMAIEASPTRMLPVKDIYEWILNHFPYFHNALSCWKNSVRHNLSLNKCFRKVEKDRTQAIGKGSFWCVDPNYRRNLLKSLHKTPYYSYCQLQMLANPPTRQSLYTHGLKSQPLQPGIQPNSVSSYSDVQDVAQTLVSLKTCKAKTDDASFAQGLKRKCGEYSPPRQVLPRRQQVICTNYPSMDHTYSSTQVKLGNNDECVSGSPRSSIDEEYDFGMDNNIDKDFSDTSVLCHRDNFDSEGESGADEVDGCFPSVNNNNNHWTVNQVDIVYSDIKCHRLEETSEEEKKRLAEGADALLNLAGICLSRQNALNRAISTEHLDET